MLGGPRLAERSCLSCVPYTPGLGSRRCNSLRSLECWVVPAPACISQGPEHIRELAQERFTNVLLWGKSQQRPRPECSSKGAVRGKPVASPCRLPYSRWSFRSKQWGPLEGFEREALSCVWVSRMFGIREGLRLEAGEQVLGLNLISVRRLERYRAHTHRYTYTGLHTCECRCTSAYTQGHTHIPHINLAQRHRNTHVQAKRRHFST